MSTLAQLRSQLITEIDIDPKQRLFSTQTLNTNINRALRKIEQDANYGLPENRALVLVSPSTQETNLPSDFVKIGSPESVKQGDSNPVMPADYFALLSQYNLNDTSGSAQYYYVRKDAGQWIFGIYPHGGGGTITVPYQKKLTEMVADSDNSPLDEDFDEAIVQYAKYLTIRRKQGKEQAAVDALAGFKEAYADAVGNRVMYNPYDLQVSHQRLSSGYDYNPRGTGYIDTFYG